MARRTDSKGRILRSGEGQRAEDGRYTYRYTDIFGKRHTVYSTSLPDLREKEKEIQRDLEDGIDTSGGEMTLNELFDLYMKTKTNLRTNTRTQNISLWKNHVESSSIGNMKIKAIKAAHINEMYADLSKRGFCAGTIKEIHKLIKASLEMAVDSDMIRKNPAKNCGRFISGKQNNRDALSKEEESEFLNYVRSKKELKAYEPFISFLASTGLRASEMCGLTWNDIDMKKNIIHVRRQLLYQNTGSGREYCFGDLKTDAGKRDIPLTGEARKALLNQRQLDLLLGKQKKEIAGTSDFVFTNGQGKPLTVYGIDSTLDRIVKKHNQEEDGPEMRKISAHILRHSYASRMAESGLDAEVLRVILGHSNIATTLGIYVQEDESEIQRKVFEAEQNMMAI